ncbi:formate/nitrite transporter family protein [Candidatus Saccharibacteria bacterium]|nr:formate/nitrite transporter family protein [Candidatus Saccharibacteria bacterium]
MKKPDEIAGVAVKVGEGKARLPIYKMLLLGIMAGAFIALAGVAATFGNVYGGKIAGACIFPAGLAMVVVAGSELFTGNNLMSMALLDRKIGFLALLKNWAFVFLGNLIGAVAVAGVVVLSGAFDNIADTVVATATAKVSMGFFEAMLRGVLCNFLVCIAVWMAFGAETVSGKIIAVFFPIMVFVLCGFEHSVANMFYVPAGIFENLVNDTYGGALTAEGFLLNNLLPVTIGNIIGGALLVGGIYYLVYLKKQKVDKK